MVTNVTNATGTKTEKAVIFTGHLVSLGTTRRRWAVEIPKEAALHLGKRTQYEVTFRAIGTIPSIKILPEIMHAQNTR